MKYIVRAAALGFAVKIYLAVTTYGTNDLLNWELFLIVKQLYGGIGLYHRVEHFNHPPFIIHVLSFLGLLKSWTPLPFQFWLRLPAILADFGSVILVWKILAAGNSLNRDPLAVLLLALCPTSIMVSGFHGNTDPLMMFLVLLSVYLIECHASPLFAGAVIGLATNVKVVPVVFLPVILFYLRNTPARVKFVLGGGVAFVVTSLPYIVEDPAFIFVRIFAYSSIYGQWGLSRIMNLLAPEYVRSLTTVGKILVVAAILIASFWMNRRDARPSLFLQLGLVMFVFMSLTPGFGIQYLAWLVPWVVGLGVGVTLSYYLAAGVFQFLVYSFWSGWKFPWFFADSLSAGSWKGELVVAEIIVWLVVVTIAVFYLAAMSRFSDASHLLTDPLLSRSEGDLSRRS